MNLSDKGTRNNVFLGMCVNALMLLFLLSSSYAWADVKSENIASTQTEYLMGVFPYLAPRELEIMYSPVAASYAESIETGVLFRTSSTYKKFMKNLNAQVYDIVFVQPFDYVTIADKFGYRPLATRNKLLPAILVVKEDSPIKSTEQLKGKVIALPPEVAAISYLVKNYLTDNGINIDTDVTIKHYKSHGSCMRNVLIGAADACGTAPPALRFFQAKMHAKLKTIARTESIPNSIFAVHPRVPEKTVEILKKVIFSWPSSEEGKALLDRLKVEKFIPVEDSVYDKVRLMAKKYRK